MRTHTGSIGIGTEGRRAQTVNGTTLSIPTVRPRSEIEIQAGGIKNRNFWAILDFQNTQNDHYSRMIPGDFRYVLLKPELYHTFVSPSLYSQQQQIFSLEQGMY